MNLFRTHPLFSTLMIVALIIVGVEAWFVLGGQREERELETQLQFRLTELERLQRQKPAPNEQNLQRVRDAFAQNALVLSTMLRSLNVVGPDELEYFKGEPGNRTDAYFDIAQFVDRMRSLARETEVTLKPDERFGFSAYANEGPEPDFIRTVYRQRRIVDYLLQQLFAARPHALVSVQRENPVVAKPVEPARPGARGAAPASAPAPASGSGDLFSIDPQVSARTPGYVDTMAFRISFTGQTAALRGFMNALAAPEIPLVVRSVEVEPHVADSTRTSGSAPPSIFSRAPTPAAPQAPSANVPIVAENDARFTVTIELFDVKIKAPEPEEVGSL